MADQKLTVLEHIRLRPGMYVGYLDNRGLKSMIGYLFDDILSTNAENIEIYIDFKTDSLISIKFEDIETELFIETLENLNVKNKLISFGLPVIIGVSEEVNISITNNFSAYSLTSVKGNFKFKKEKISSQLNSMEVVYQIDQAIFKDTQLNYDVINQFFRMYAYLNPTCKIISHDSRRQIQQTNIFDYPKGLSHFLDYKICEQLHGISIFRLDLSTKIDEYEYQVCISYLDVWLAQTHIQTYANYDELIFGGSLEDGIIDGLYIAIKQTANKKQVKIDRRKIKKQLILLAVIKGETFEFYGSTKIKLSMPKVRKKIKEFITDETLKYLSNNDNVEEQILDLMLKDE